MTKKHNRSQESNETSKENIYLSNVKSMLGASVGRLPTILVMIFLLSAAMATLAAVVLQYNQPAPKSNMFMPLRLEPTQNAVKIDSKFLQGNWIYQTSDYAMTLTFIGDRFEWIMVFSDVTDAQYYARGNYRLEGDVMVLGIRNDLGLPYDPDTPWMKYMPIAFKDLNAYVSRDGRGLNWKIPGSEQDQISSKPAEIFVNNPEGFFDWVKQ